MATDVKILIGAVDATGGVISKVSTDLKNAQREAATSAEVFKSMGNAMTGAFSVGAVVAFGKSVIDAGMQMERLTNAMTVVAGSSAGAKSEMAWVSAEADRLGLALGTTADAYTKFSAAAMGTSLQGEGVKKVFSAISGATTVLGMSADQAQGVFTALGQMMGKGTVQAEELRGQLGERMPGAFQLAAKAMGVTTAELGKMLEQGQVVASDFLPKFADEVEKRFGKQIPEAIKSTQAELNRLQNKWLELKQLMYDGGSVKSGAGALSGALDLGKNAIGAMGESKAYWTGQFKKAGVFARFLFGGGDALEYQQEMDAINTMMEVSVTKWEQRLGNIGGGMVSGKDTNAKQRQMLDAAIVKEAEAARQKELADLQELFTWQENRIQQLKEIDAELKAIRETEIEKADFERTMAELKTKAAERKIKDQITELENTAKQTEALKTLQMELLKLDAEYQAETAEQAKLNGLVDKRTSLTTQLEIATLKKDKATADGLTAQLALLDQLIGKTKQQITLSTEAQIRQNILTGKTVGVYLDSNGNPVQVGANSWESQNQYVSNSQLTGGNSGPVSFSDSAFSPGQITGGNTYINNITLPTMAADAAGAAKIILPALQQLQGRTRA